jgi:protoporphyrinogen oxidase
MANQTSRSGDVVIGAGLSGLAAARALMDLGRSPEVFEVCAEPGGLTRTTVVGQFSFDYTGHLLHLARHDTPADLPYAGQDNTDWLRIDRRAYCFLGNTLVPAPIQYNMGLLPGSMRSDCIRSYDARDKEAPRSSHNLRDYLVQSFGRYLAEVFLIPQNEKTLAIPVDRLSEDALRRFFPPPDETRVRRGMAPTGSPVEGGYNSCFWYPRVGGISRLIRGLARGIDRMHLSTGVISLNLPQRRLKTTEGAEIGWDVLLSSMSLVALSRMSGDRDLAALSSRLTNSATLCINLGIRGTLGDAVRDAHWVYVPDENIPFYRFGVYSNLGGRVAPPDHSSVYVEVALRPSDARDPASLVAIEARACDALFQLGWVRPESVVCRVTQRLDCAYVHLTPERDGIVAEILHRLAKAGVYPIGRYGCWDYTSMEESILSGIETARRVAS